MPEEKFTSLRELYERLMPALRTKKRMMKQEKYIVSEEDIWNYFCSYVWINKKDLTLGEMVDDILNTKATMIYIREGVK